MAKNDTHPQAEGQTGATGQAPAKPRQMEGQTQPVAPQQGSTPLRDWASI